MYKRGTTLLETVISIFIVAVVIVSFLEALNVGMIGTLNLDRKTSALNLAKSQLEYIKAQVYNNSSGAIGAGGVYGLITYNVSDRLNYNISGQVTRVNNLSSLQQITINVTYLNGRQEQLIGYKAAQNDLSSPPARGQIVTDVILDPPMAPEGGKSLSCLWDDWTGENSSCGTYTGFYHVITTSRDATITATWAFDWVNELYDESSGIYTWGAPTIGIYEGIPAWVSNDSQGNVEKDGVIFRGAAASYFQGGCMPGCACDETIASDYAPIVMAPDSCTMTLCAENDFDTYIETPWSYEKPPGSKPHFNYCLFWYISKMESGSYEFSATTPSYEPAGPYTVLFFNGEDRISLVTTSASITYTY